MITGADLDSLIVSFPISPERVEEIFLRPEGWKLDFKREYNPSNRADVVEITKDIAAFANTAGGYLVVGVDDAGNQLGLSAESVKAIDEAVVRSQVQSYFGTVVDLFVSSVSVSGKQFVIITILQSPRSPLVFQRDGSYKLPSGATKDVFRTGDVFVRHGSASERWNQSDVKDMYARVVEREKERWMTDVIPDIRKLLQMSRLPNEANAAPADPSLLLKSDAETFEKALRSIIREAKS